MTIRCYSELKRLDNFIDRFEYLKLSGVVGVSTFGYDRYLNQLLYQSRQWKNLRDEIIIRDEGCDLGIIDRIIIGKIIIHHMNPIAIADIKENSDLVFNPNYLICTSFETHNAIHYSNTNLLQNLPKERTPQDTTLWVSKRSLYKGE